MLLKVASYNIRKAIGTDRRRAPERVLDVLNEIDADVVALQEADRRFGARASALPAGLIAAQTHYEPVEFGIREGSLGWHGNAILVRRGTTVRAALPLDLPTLEPRGAALAEIELSGRRLRVVGMHLDLSGMRRRAQARAVIEQVAGRPDQQPTVLMGDLNEWRRIGGCLADFAASYAIAATGPSFHSRRPLGRLDRIMAGGGAEIVDCGVHHSHSAVLASDHLPVWAQLRLA